MSRSSPPSIADVQANLVQLFSDNDPIAPPGGSPSAQTNAVQIGGLLYQLFITDQASFLNTLQLLGIDSNTANSYIDAYIRTIRRIPPNPLKYQPQGVFFNGATGLRTLQALNTTTNTSKISFAGWFRSTPQLMPVWITDPSGNNNPFLKILGFAQGAVKFNNNSSIVGGSAVTKSNFTKGVLSFWMNYDSTATASGDSVKTGQQGTSSAFSACASATSVATSAQFQVGSIAILVDPTNINLLLRDATSSSPLVSVSAEYNTSSVSGGSLFWFRCGTFPECVVPPLSTFNGVTYGNFTSVVAGPCGGLLKTYTTGVISADAGHDPFCSSLPAATPFGKIAFLLTGTPGLYIPSQVPADVYVVTQAFLPNNPPPTGWHHYIFSFDTSQLVTDQNSASCIRVQCAIDRKGGPAFGGPLFDTASGSVGASSQPFFSQSEQFGVTGSVSVSPNDTWVIGAPSDAPCQLAYCYFGVPGNDRFFDLTDPSNLDLFINESLQARDLSKITSLTPIFLHDGNTGNFANNDAGGNAWTLSGSWSDASPPPFVP